MVSIRRLLWLFLLLLAGNVSWAQLGNEWINFSQEYYKISISKDSIYQLSYDHLAASGFPVTSVDPRFIQLFHRGVEQAIYVSGQDDGIFDPGDYIEFYGRKNDGSLDTELYVQPEVQVNPYYNLYSDNTSYFLTVKPSIIPGGKRMVDYLDNNVTNIPKETYHTREKLMVLKNEYAVGNTVNSYIQVSGFDRGEGWTGAEIRNGGFRDYVFSDLLNGVPSGGLPQLEMALVGRNAVDHQAEISVGPNSSSLRFLTTQVFSEYNKHIVVQSLAWSDISVGGTLTVRVQTPDRVSVSYIKVRYPQVTTAESLNYKLLELRVNGSDKSYVEITNAPAGSLLYDVTDPNSPIRIGTSPPLNAVIRYTSSVRKLLVFNPAAASSVSIERVSFRQINPAGHNYIVISHPLLMQPALGYSDVVRAYAGYRASTAGGSFDTLVVDINQLYNQFNYGEPSPRAIRQFMKFMLNTGEPKYLFLIGKGLDVYEGYHRAPSSSKFTTYKDFVPTAGLPGSDTHFTAGLAGTTSPYEPAVPTGRISVTNPIQIGAYLNKVKEMEAMPFDNLWRKNILHLSGGGNAQELEFFRLYLEEFQHVAESHYLGGKATVVAKQSTNLEFINISEQINNGLNLVTFFGHSAPQATDIEIGFVTDPALGYSNPGRYPVFLINGCSAGTFFSTFDVFGEDWINAANKGAIGVLAHSSYGLAPTLRRYSELFYQYAYGDSSFIKKGIGDVQKEICREYMNGTSTVEYNIAQVQQMILLGDPAVSVFGAKKPDYEVNDDNLYVEAFDGGPVTALSDSFALHFIVRNFGIAAKDTIKVSVQRKYNDNSISVYDTIFPSVLYQDTLTFVMKKENQSGFGNNIFTVTIDSDAQIQELNESNNSALAEIFIPLSATKNLFPYDFAIVSQASVDLAFQCTDLLSEERQFQVEIDTIDTFNSSFKKTFTATGKVLARQHVELLSQDSLTYYWRTRLATPLPGESDEWATTSFTYIHEGPEGWAQIHFPQYMKNETEGLVRDASLRKLEFEETEVEVLISNAGSSSSAGTSVKINNVEYLTGVQLCRENTINLIAFDKNTSVPYNEFPGSDIKTCGRTPPVIMNYKTTEIESGANDIIDYIESIETGDHVILFSIRDAGYGSWSATVKNKLGELGISVAQIDALQPGEPVVIIGKKGDVPGTASVFKTSGSPANAQELVTHRVLTGNYTSGLMTGPYIGPASHWQSLFRKTGSAEPEDEAVIDITGINLNGEDTVLFEGVAGELDLTSVDAGDYPYLQLTYAAGDEMNLTPVQLKNWIVSYTPVPEGILFSDSNPDHFSVKEGEPVTVGYGFTNISAQIFSDSLLVSVNVFNKLSRTSEKKDFSIKAPLPGDTTLFSFTIETLGKSGLNDLDVFVNRRIAPEQYYENNVMERYDYVEVIADIFMPVLDVTVDGRHLLNGDYVSPDPFIDIRVWDENNFIIKEDTTGIHLFLQSPCETADCPFERISFTRNDIQWFPATDTSDFTIEFRPANLQPGIYRMMIEARDGNGNLSGAAPYEITFEVSNESSVTLFAPYPNPANDLVYFTLVVSGDSEPAQVELSVINLNGKTVHGLTWNDIRIGTNTFSWNGRGADGRMPAGLYIYQLTVLDKNGKEMNMGTQSGQTFFKDGYGKLVLVR